MLMHEVQFPGGTPIDGYAPGVFGIAGQTHHGGLLLLPGGVLGWAPGPSLVIEDFAAVIEAAAAIDVLLVGLGPEIGLLDPAVRRALEAAGLGVEVMATPPACRTYNVLLAENRRVAAALRPV